MYKIRSIFMKNVQKNQNSMLFHALHNVSNAKCAIFLVIGWHIIREHVFWFGIYICQTKHTAFDIFSKRNSTHCLKHRLHSGEQFFVVEGLHFTTLFLFTFVFGDTIRVYISILIGRWFHGFIAYFVHWAQLRA